jgi:hypothetical protein
VLRQATPIWHKAQVENEALLVEDTDADGVRAALRALS